MLSFIVGVIVFSVLGIDFKTALGAAASTLGNVGSVLGDLVPVHTYEYLPSLAKLWAALLMLIGTLELFTVLILFTLFSGEHDRTNH